MTVSCETCKWWDSALPTRNNCGGNGKTGLCRFNNPYPMLGGYVSQKAPWPETWPKDWCGKHEPKRGDL